LWGRKKLVWDVSYGYDAGVRGGPALMDLPSERAREKQHTFVLGREEL
jgi:hypothetical protein